MSSRGNTLAPWQRELNRITFGIDTRAGRAFDIVLLLVILLSVIVVMLESVEEIRRDWGLLLLRIEWGLTFLFSVEYVLRLSCVERPWKYAFSFSASSIYSPFYRHIWRCSFLVRNP